MQKIACPSCGGEVCFRSAASVMAVCGYCHSTLLKDAESVKNIGKMSETLEDYSPLQITTSGIYHGRNFAIVGRLQLRYANGIWNEWHILFDDGESGWLADAQGQYVLTLPQAATDPLPVFDVIKPGMRVRLAGADFRASDVRTAHCIGGEGELPFAVGKGWAAKVVDFRVAHRFMTLDYSNGPVPQVFLGQAVTLEQLRCQLLRDQEQISHSSQRFRGKATVSNCPSCGASIQYRPGVAYHVMCSACHAEIDYSTDKALILQKATELEQMHTTIVLGDMATINGSKYETIGLMLRQTVGSDESICWVEYLLFNHKQGFVWLVETGNRWDKVSVLNEWPDGDGGKISLTGDVFDKQDEYDAVVTYAAGAFNWRVSIGDRAHLIEYKKGNRTVCAESDTHEVTWSSSRQVTASQVGLWFGKKLTDVAAPDATSAYGITAKNAWIFTAILLVINLPICFVSGESGINLLMFATLILWIPFSIVKKLGETTGSAQDSSS